MQLSSRGESSLWMHCSLLPVWLRSSR
jgi:hypothetical protein